MNQKLPSAQTRKRSTKRPAPSEAVAPAETAQARAAKTAANTKPAPQPHPSKDGAAVGKAAKKAPPSEAAETSKRPKLVRDSFTMPEVEYQALVDVKKTCLQAGLLVKKSELLRIGVALVRGLDVAKIKQRQARLTPLATGRPKKNKKDASKAGKKG